MAPALSLWVKSLSLIAPSFFFNVLQCDYCKNSYFGYHFVFAVSASSIQVHFNLEKFPISAFHYDWISLFTLVSVPVLESKGLEVI